jgi:esterase/lipase
VVTDSTVLLHALLAGTELTHVTLAVWPNTHFVVLSWYVMVSVREKLVGVGGLVVGGVFTVMLLLAESVLAPRLSMARALSV